MLVTDPKQRATLGEILNHSWITKGFNASPENYLPHREPLQLPLDPEVIEKMTGFDFGSSDFITRELTKVLSSEEYQTAVRLNAREHSHAGNGGEKKRGVFDFYKRRSSVTSRDTLLNLSAEAVQLGSDPINAFSPLISIYYLVKEKKERERTESNPGGLSMPISPGEKPLKIPDLPAPEAAYTNATTYEMPGEKATGGRSRPRSRTHGEDEIADGMKKVNLNAAAGRNSPPSATHPTEATPPKKESAAVGLLRRFSTRRAKESPRGRIESQNTPSLQLQPPADQPAPTRKSFSVRRARNKEPAPSLLLHPGGSTPHQPDLLTPPATFGATSRVKNSLDRSASVSSVDHRRRHSRRGVSEGNPIIASPDPPMTSGSEKSSTSGQNPNNVAEQDASDPRPSAVTHSASSRTKSLGHARRESVQVRRSQREETNEDNVPEENNQQVATGNQQPNKAESLENMKPVYLKGLFSVSTTSNKPLPFIRADIDRVLKQLGVEYVEIKGGFGCKHAPSINLNRIADATSPSADQQYTPTLGHRRRISFLGSRNADRDRDELREQERSSPAVRHSKRQAPNTSFTNSEVSEESLRQIHGEGQGGETTTHVQTQASRNMVLRFDIYIVKVPLFSLHGIQFKKVAGDTWAYKNMAQRILDALRL